MSIRSTLDRIKATLYSYETITQLAENVINENYSSKFPDKFSRSFLWKLIILKLNKINRQEGHNEIELNLSNLNSLRKDYSLLKDQIIIPWFELPKSSEFFLAINQNDEMDLTENLNKKNNLLRLRILNDPLNDPLNDSLENSNSIKNSNESDISILETIINDVNRLFPEYPEFFINNAENRKSMIRILFFFAKLSNFGYIQGQHEICGLIFVVLKQELLHNSDEVKLNRKNEFSKLDLQIFNLMDSDFLENDTFNILVTIMKPILPKFFTSSGIIQQSIVFDINLHKFDKLLYSTLHNNLKINSQIWLLRYFRLILTREIGLKLSVELWDHLIAFSKLQNNVDISLLIDKIILLLLELIRENLITSDYTDSMFLLLHYPNDKIKDLGSLIRDSIKLYHISNSNFERDSLEIMNKYKNLNSLDYGRKKKSQFFKNAWKSNKSETTIQPNGYQTEKNLESHLDLDRARLEMKLKRKVRDKLK